MFKNIIPFVSNLNDNNRNTVEKPNHSKWVTNNWQIICGAWEIPTPTEKLLLVIGLVQP